jgi:hypothetical protein
MPLAAAAYNAGPGRPRNWRNGPVMDAAIWAENVPFSETRDYVKKVLSNTTNYAAILTGQPQSLKARLGTVGPRDAAQPEPNRPALSMNASWQHDPGHGRVRVLGRRPTSSSSRASCCA